MTFDRRKQRATEDRIWALFRDRQLPEEAWEPLQRILGKVPAKGEWVGFIDRLLLIAGTAFLIAGIFFFFAFNWDDLGKFGRFALLEGAVVLATILAFVLKLDTWPGRMSLMAAALLIGPTMGVIGQAYQTGADSYTLFLRWLLLITGWVLISRWNFMYLIWMILLNLTISLYWWQVVGENGYLLNIIILTINTAFVVLWDTILNRGWFHFMREARWFLYIVMAPGLSYATFLMLDYIFEFDVYYGTLNEIAPLVYALMLAVIIGFYTLVRRDLLMLTMTALSVLVVAVSGIGRIIFETIFERTDDPFFFFFLMGFITVGLTAAFAKLLRDLQKRWERES